MHGKGTMDKFHRNWTEYKNGFGSIKNKAYWMGLEKIHRITNTRRCGLKVTWKMYDGTSRVGNWDEFRVSGEEDKFRLTIGGWQPSSSWGKSELQYHNGMQFSTADSDNDMLTDDNCAIVNQDINQGHYGWWYNDCYLFNANHDIMGHDEVTMIIEM